MGEALFHPDTGLRMSRYRAPTPAAIEGARVVDAAQVVDLARRGAALVDVLATPTGRYDELDGTWLVAEPRQTLPGAVWLPEVGRGTLPPSLASWFAAELRTLTGGDLGRPIVFFCVADCWMSWNAAIRAARLGYAAVRWFPGGTDDWAAAGLPLVPVWPRPAPID
jgi:PQQ-dependent catabolism-associated CXXCW motif protein